MATKKLKSVAQPLAIPEGFQLLPVPVLVYQKEHDQIWANAAFERVFGVALTTRFAAKASLALVQERKLNREVFSQEGRHEGYSLETASGAKVPVEIKVSSLANLAGDCFLVLVEDVSPKVDLEKQLIQNHLELKRTQDALVQSAKLASLGELSSGIAHELNQPLQAIMGFSQELAHVENLTATGHEFVQDIVHASRKMAEIIKSLRTFVREAGDEMTLVSVEHAARESCRLMNHSLMQKGIDLTLECKSPLPMTMANGIQLEQVFINLISNARDAIESAHSGRGNITLTLTTENGWIVAKVKDDGSGMTDAVKSRIFDPFFTTKEVGKGTGLGLSITYGILKKIGAEVDVYSKPKQGTEFVLKFKPEKGEAA